jgi:hypothetical protein
MAGGPGRGIVDGMTTRDRDRGRSLLVTLAGLAVGVVGLVLQWIADPDKFGGFPPGIYAIAAAGALTWLGRRWRWSPLAAVLMGLWILVGGSLAGKLQENLASGDGLTVTGNLVMAAGLLVAVVAGGTAIARAGRSADRRAPDGTPATR